MFLWLVSVSKEVNKCHLFPIEPKPQAWKKCTVFELIYYQASYLNHSNNPTVETYEFWKWNDLKLRIINALEDIFVFHIMLVHMLLGLCKNLLYKTKYDNFTYINAFEGFNTIP